MNVTTFLVLTFGPTTALSMKESWSSAIRAVRAQARRAYARNPCLTQRIHYAQMCLLAKIWHVAEIFPLTHMHAQQISPICSWFFWQGATFRVPTPTVQRPNIDGGWGFPSVEVKCKTLLYKRIQTMGAREESVASELMRIWNIPGALPKPLTPTEFHQSSSIFVIMPLIWFM